MSHGCLAIAVLVFTLLVPVGAGAQEAAPTPTVAAQGNDDGGNEELWQIATLVLGVLSVVGTLGGTWLGHHLSERAADRRDAKAQAQQSDSVRTLLGIEIDQNLADLARLWVDVVGVRPDAFEPLGEQINPEGHAGVFISHEMPVWSRLMWESQAALLPTALGPNEIAAVHRHYADLATLSEYHERLLAVRRADIDRPPVEVQGVYGPPALMPSDRHFGNEARATWPEIERLVADLGKLGNPIKQESPTGSATDPAPRSAD